MPKKKTKKAQEAPPWWRKGFVPCVARDPASVGSERFARVFMLAPTFEGTMAVQAHPNIPSQVGVRERVIPADQANRFTLITEEETALHSHLEELKTQMLTHGASREAVRLVGEHIPITDKEYREMAAKLTKKAPAKKASTKKAPAKKAASDAPAKGGRKHSLDEKAKITLTEKGEAKLKKGADTGATQNLEAMKKAKTVGKALEAGLKPGDITYAEKTGTIELG